MASTVQAVYLNVPDGEKVDSIWFNIPDGQKADSIWLQAEIFDAMVTRVTAYIAGNYGMGYATVTTEPATFDFEPIFEVEALQAVYGFEGADTTPKRLTKYVYKADEDGMSDGWWYDEANNQYFLGNCFYQVGGDSDKLVRVRIINPETGMKSSWASTYYTTEEG